MLIKTAFVPATVLLALAATYAAPAATENPSCEQLGSYAYRITYQPPTGVGPVQVFASSHPDQIDSPTPLLTMRSASTEITVSQQSASGQPARVYFHLKPAKGSARVVSVRRLPLEGAKNFRDLGGYRTTDGRYIRWGLVYRSNFLTDLTPNDYDYLEPLGIRLVCDLRADLERMRSPTSWIGNRPAFLNVPIGANRDGTLTPEELQKRVAAINAQTSASAKGYDYATAGAEQYGIILHRMAAGDLPILVHDTSGKDRAGLFAAILLTALGVPRETVISDYLLTTKYMLAPDAIKSTTAGLQSIFGLPDPPDFATVKAIMTVHPETLAATFENITKTYGSFENYLSTALHLSDSDISSLRTRLLEP